MRGRATVADVHGRIEITDGNRDLSIRKETFDVVHAFQARVDLNHPAKGASPNAMRGQPVWIRVWCCGRELQCHERASLERCEVIERLMDAGTKPSITIHGTTTPKRY